MLKLSSILNTVETETNLSGKKIKLVRHKSKNHNLEELEKQGHFNIYQGYQKNPLFRDCDYIISFFGEENNNSKFYGVFRVIKESRSEEVHHEGYPYKEPDCYFYELEEVLDFSHFKNRLIIDWGNSTRSWVQWYDRNEKEVFQILPKNIVSEFKSFYDFILSYDELQKLFKYPDDNAAWRTALSAVNGLYLIADHKSGMQYIGSAYGEDGIWGRWKNYASKADGGNLLLKNLLQDKGQEYAQNFRFTVLITLSKSLSKKEVIKQESLYKMKFGTRTFGLNGN